MKQNKIIEAETTTVSPAFAKLPVSRRVWVVYPDSVRMGLSDENRPAAWFIYSDHAHKFGKLMWEGFYEVKYEEIHGG